MARVPDIAHKRQSKPEGEQEQVEARFDGPTQQGIKGGKQGNDADGFEGVGQRPVGRRQDERHRRCRIE